MDHVFCLERRYVYLMYLLLCVQEMTAEVCGALAQSDPNLVLSAAFKLRITQRDLATLQEGGWLNDEVRCRGSGAGIILCPIIKE